MNRLQKCLSGPYFAAFLDHSPTMGRRNRQNLASPSRFFALDPPSPAGSWWERAFFGPVPIFLLMIPSNLLLGGVGEGPRRRSPALEGEQMRSARLQPDKPKTQSLR